jgi:hypothetical protein
MANPFKEAEKAKKKAPGSKQEPEVKEVPTKEEKPAEAQEKPVEPVVEKVEEKKVEEPVVKTEVKPQIKRGEKGTKDIFASLTAEKPTGKTYAFYLSDENVAKLKKMAEKKGISASKLLDHILSEIL